MTRVLTKVTDDKNKTFYNWNLERHTWNKQFTSVD